MGMSASQVRMLSLTSRLSDLEFSAQSISNSKIRLADQSASASQLYQDSLDKEKLTIRTSDSTTNVDATAYNLTTYQAISGVDKQRFISDASGRVLVTTKVGNDYDNSQNLGSESSLIKATYSTVNAYLNHELNYSTPAEASAKGLTYDAKQVAYLTNKYTGLEQFMNKSGYTSNPNSTGSVVIGGETVNVQNDAGATSHYANVFNEIAKHGYNSPGDDNMKDREWLYSQLTSGNIFLREYDTSGELQDISWSSGDASLQAKSDESDVARAEANYNTKLAEIKNKDTRFDLQLKEIDTEHSAIQTELDSVKKVMDKNIERSFKVFNG